MTSMDMLFQPASVAIVGASSDPDKLNGRPVTYLRRHGYKGQIFPINPRIDAIGDLKCYADARDLPVAPDLGLVLVGANRVIDAVRQLADRGTKAAIILASGFGETGEEGRARQAELMTAAGDMRILGPNTIGLVNLTDGIMLSASGAMEMAEFNSGNIALISQSGGILGSLLSRAAGRGIGFSKLVATGNEADLDVADFLNAAVDDDATDVVALYLETIRNTDSFRQAARRVLAAGKPVVVYKVGRSESGAKAAVSHTGALAGADEVYDAFFNQLGIIRAGTFNDLLDIPAALATGRRMQGNRIAIVTSTGGAATIIADNAGLCGLEMPAPDPDTAAQLRALDLPDVILDQNPIDVTLAGLRPDLFSNIIRILADSPSYDAIAVVVGSSSIGNPEVVAGPLRSSLSITDKPLIAYVSPDAPVILKTLNQNGIPAYAAPETCAAVLMALQPKRTAGWAEQPASIPVDDKDLPSGSLNEAEAKKLFSRFGIPIPREEQASSPQEAARIATRFDGPVVIKILSSEILHKSDIGGVRVGVSAEDVETCCLQMQQTVARHSTAPLDGFLVQELIRDGVELILGFNRDPQLGAYILLGAGGVTTELYHDVALRLLPVDQAQALTMIDSLKSAALLRGFRGRPHADITALADTIVAFADMVATLGDRLEEAEINPVFVLPEGAGTRAGDGLVVLK